MSVVDPIQSANVDSDHDTGVTGNAAIRPIEELQQNLRETLKLFINLAYHLNDPKQLENFQTEIMSLYKSAQEQQTQQRSNPQKRVFRHQMYMHTRKRWLRKWLKKRKPQQRRVQTNRGNFWLNLLAFLLFC